MTQNISDLHRTETHARRSVRDERLAVGVTAAHVAAAHVAVAARLATATMPAAMLACVPARMTTRVRGRAAGVGGSGRAGVAVLREGQSAKAQHKNEG